MNNQKDTKYFLITIDVEDWFQVENFKPWISFKTWDERELRVEHNVHRLLDLFDDIELPALENDAVSPIIVSSKKSAQERNRGQRNPSNEFTRRVRATFFVLGWIAERLPHLVREIIARGHEVASHGYNHELCNMQRPEALRNDLINSKKLLEDITGEEIVGYRAPSFSITNEILLQIMDAGYQYDSSWNSFKLHQRYGRVELSCIGNGCIPIQISNKFYELPISNLRLSLPFTQKAVLIFPFGGGGYFRLLPTMIFRYGVNSILNNDNAYIFYLHPWEIDSDQPRVKKAGLNYRFRHYTNLARAEGKLTKTIRLFGDCLFLSCSEYLDNVSIR